MQLHSHASTHISSVDFFSKGIGVDEQQRLIVSLPYLLTHITPLRTNLGSKGKKVKGQLIASSVEVSFVYTIVYTAHMYTHI